MPVPSSRWLFALLVAVCLVPARGAAQTAPADTAAADHRLPGPPEMTKEMYEPGQGLGESALRRAGLEDVSLPRASTLGPVAYENRRWRHSAEALGRLRREVGFPVTAIEKRFGLRAALLRPLESAAATTFDVRYPSDDSFPELPPFASSPRALPRADLELQPLVTYELGRIFEPVLLRLAVAPRLRAVPWPGGVATLAVDIPIQNDFGSTPDHPDADHTRPGQLTLDQYVWVPKGFLGTLSGGYFGDNRYGLSLGAARPLAQGALLVDAQSDVTGFVTFGPNGTEYAVPTLWTGFGSVTWRPPLWDVAFRARVERFLGSDSGVELEARRSMGDVDIAYFVQHTGGDDILGIRLVLPVPPMARAAGRRFRAQPIERFPAEYHSSSEGRGAPLLGVASREEFLRQLSRPALDANDDRYREARGIPPHAAPRTACDEVSFTGMTGFVQVPWAGSIGDRQFEVGWNHEPARWAYSLRGQHDNEAYYATVGFLPRVELSMRATQIPDYHSFQELVPESRLTDTDEMASGRLVLFEPAPHRPGIALGVEDVQGTRRFHSTYAVAGWPLQWRGVRFRAAAGYAPRILDATRYVLDGGFGALEVSPVAGLALQLENDTEKWNAAVGLKLPWGLRFRAAWLDLDRVTYGGGLHFAL